MIKKKVSAWAYAGLILSILSLAAVVFVSVSFNNMVTLWIIGSISGIIASSIGIYRSTKMSIGFIGLGIGIFSLLVGVVMLVMYAIG